MIIVIDIVQLGEKLRDVYSGSAAEIRKLLKKTGGPIIKQNDFELQIVSPPAGLLEHDIVDGVTISALIKDKLPAPATAQSLPSPVKPPLPAVQSAFQHMSSPMRNSGQQFNTMAADSANYPATPFKSPARPVTPAKSPAQVAPEAVVAQEIHTQQDAEHTGAELISNDVDWSLWDVSFRQDAGDSEVEEDSSAEMDLVVPDVDSEESGDQVLSQPFSANKPPRPAGNVFEAAIQQLDLSAVPRSLPCREAEHDELFSFLKSNIAPHGHGHIFLTGIPGAGKTATVREVMVELMPQVRSVQGTRYIELNAMAFAGPTSFFEHFAKELTPSAAKHSRSKSSFVKLIESWMQRAKAPCILLLDEIDRLVNGRAADQVMYDLLNWTTSHLLLIGISNTMDLTERLQARITSRFGLQTIEFRAYTREQLSQIISDRISHLGLFDADAIDWASRNVVRISGDARRALEYCRSAVALAQEKYEKKGRTGAPRVKAKHVEEILEQAGSSVTVQALQTLPFFQRLMLCAVVRLRTISPEARITHHMLLDRFDDWLRLHRLPALDRVTVDGMLVSLQECRFLSLNVERLESGVELILEEDDISAAYVNNPAFWMEFQWLSGQRS